MELLFKGWDTATSTRESAFFFSLFVKPRTYEKKENEPEGSAIVPVKNSFSASFIIQIAQAIPNRSTAVRE